MTYLFTVQGIVWGLMILVHVIFEELNFLRVGDLFWPDIVTYIWAILIVVMGNVMLFFLLRDFHDRSKVRIWISAKANLSLWVFAMLVWIAHPGGHIMVIVSIMNVIGCAYIGLASRNRSKIHRV